MTTFEQAFIAAAKAFLAVYSTPKQTEVGIPTPTSHGVPVCQRHGKAMKEGKFGYYCTSKEDDPDFANKNGYCNAKARQ